MNYLAAIYMTFFGFLVLSSCTTGSKSDSAVSYDGQKNPKPPAGVSPSPALQITTVGINTNPEFSPNGRRIAFISSDRPRQKSKQIFEYDLADKTTKRVTFLHGEILELTYNEKSNVIYYSSNTDEIKERPPLITKRDFDKEHPPTEIYRMMEPSGKIDRLTDRPGYDGQPQVDSKNENLYLVQHNNGQYFIKTRTLKKRENPRTIYTTKYKIEDLSVSAENRQLLWTEIENANYQVYTSDLSGKNRILVSIKGKNHRHSSWHPSGKYVIYSSNEVDTNNYELYVADKNFQCRNRLTYNVGQDFHPKFDPSGTRIVFQSDRSGQSQVYMMNFTAPAACN